MRERNLAAYFADRPRQAALLGVHRAREVEWGLARSGAFTVRYRGQLLHSSVDPEAEARALFGDGVAREADVVVLFGLGAGHALRALREISDARVLVFEPSPDLLAEALDRLDLAGDPTLRPDGIVGDLADLRSRLPAVYRVGEKLALAAPPAYRRLFPAEAAALSEEISFFTAQAALAERTYDLRLAVWIENLLENLPARARFASAASLEGRFAGVPAVIVSAGPSLSRNASRLAAFRDRALILSTNTAYRALDRVGVTPDLVVAIEALDVRVHLEGVARLEQTHALLDGVAHPGLYGLPYRGGFVFDDGIPFYQRWLERHFAPVVDWSSGLCVAHAAFSAALAMGCDPVILVGQDLAHTGGRVYADGTVFSAMTATADGDRVRLGEVEAKLAIERRTAERHPGLSPFRAEETRVRLPGYHGGEVESTLTFAAFRRWFENAAVLHGGSRTLWNATEGGARIEGWIQRPLSDIARELGPALGLRERLDELAAVPGLPRPALGRAAREAAAELEAIVGAARQALRSPSYRDRVRALSRDHTLLNGYLRRQMREIQSAAREGRGGQALERRLYRAIGDGAARLAEALERAALEAEGGGR